MKMYTIGFTKKTAEQFFSLLKTNDVKILLDTRLNNVSQLSGFAKGKDLEYFCKEILGIKYIYDIRFAPNEKILSEYRDKKITWTEYEKEYKDLLDSREILQVIREEYMELLDGICILCSEELPNKCHRRLLSEYISERVGENNIAVKHII